MISVLEKYRFLTTSLCVDRFASLNEIGLIGAADHPHTPQQACHPVVVRVLKVRNQTLAVFPQLIPLYSRRFGWIWGKAILEAPRLLESGQPLHISRQRNSLVKLFLGRKF